MTQDTRSGLIWIGFPIVCLLAAGCTARPAKQLSSQLRQATAQKATADKEIYRKLVDYIHSDFKKQVDIANERLQTRLQERLRDAQERMDVAFLSAYATYVKEIDDKNRDKFDGLDTERKVADQQLADAKGPLSQTTARLKIAEIENRRRYLQKGIAEAKLEMFHSLWAKREAAIKDTEKAYTTSFQRVKAQIEELSKFAEKMATGIEDLIGQLQQLDTAIAEGSLQLDEYLQRKSALALAGSALAAKLGIAVSPDRIDGWVNQGSERLQERLNSVVDRFLGEKNSPKEMVPAP